MNKLLNFNMPSISKGGMLGMLQGGTVVITLWEGGSSQNAVISGNNVTLNGGSGWTNWALGHSLSKPQTIEYSVTNTNQNIFLGFGNGNTPSDSGGFSAMGYSFYLTSAGDVYWIDSSGASDTGANRASGDTYKIEWTSGDDVVLSVKPTGSTYSVVKTWSSISETTLYAIAQGYPDSSEITITPS